MKQTTHITVVIALLFCFCFTANAQKGQTPESGTAGSVFGVPVKKPKLKAKKSTAVGNKFQDLTSRFNRYFNAKLKFEEGMLRLAESHKDDYEEILPVYVYKGGDGSSISGDLDQTISKASAAIQLKPYSKWIDDCYVLVGQAQYLMGDYDAATESFQYVTSKFSNNIRLGDKKTTAENNKKAAAKAKEQSKKEKEKTQAQLKKEKEEARKQKEQERKETQKAKEKAKKELDKQRAEERKQKDKERKEREKEREKAKKAKSKGKTSSNSTNTAKPEIEINYFHEDGTRLTAAEVVAAKKEARAKLKAEEKQKELEAEQAKIDAEAVTKKENEAKEAKKEATDIEGDKDEETAIAEDEPETATEIPTSNKNYNSGGGSHTPSNFEAMLWLTQTYIDMDQMSDAETVLNLAFENSKFPKDLSDELNVLAAHFYLKKKDYPKAKTALKTAIDATKKKKDKVRLYYILAQLEQRDQRHNEALKMFQKVLKSRPDYEMEFNAKINIATTKLQGGDFNTDQAIAYLEKMTKDGKNTEYLDQIYFAMAEVAMLTGDMETAMNYLENSTESSSSSTNIKSRAFLKLADLYYEQEKYELASAYYDSTLVVLDKEHSRIDEITTRKETLGELVRHINTVANQDSLLRIAKMPEAARNEFIDDLIAQLEKEAEAKRRAEEQEANFLQGTTTAAASATDGYFFNSLAKERGKADFTAKWGDRPLADNWRRSSALNTSGFIAAIDTTATTRDDLVVKAVEGTLSKEDILADLPLSPEAQATANQQITDALFNIGSIYREKLKNNPKSVTAFENLQSRYPQNEYAAQVFYNLYLIETDEGNASKAAQHRQTILTKYPETVYAKILKDGNYLETLSQQGAELEKYYEATYALYKQGSFDQVLQRADEVNTLFVENPLQPKFDFLLALIKGHTEDKNAYVAALKNIVVAYPDHEVKQKAEEMLAYLGSGSSSAPTKPIQSGLYNYNPNAPHYLVVALDSYTQLVNTTTNNLSDFNMGNFSGDKLKVNQMLLDPENQIVLVKDFKDAQKALVYYKALQKNEVAVFQGLDTTYKYFVISKPNFMQYFKEKDADSYYSFFQEYYQ